MLEVSHKVMEVDCSTLSLKRSHSGWSLLAGPGKKEVVEIGTSKRIGVNIIVSDDERCRPVRSGANTRIPSGVSVGHCV